MIEIDNTIILKAAIKDEQAFKKVYDHYAPPVWRVIYRTSNSERNEAIEILRETFIKVYSSLHEFPFNSGLSIWIYRIAFNAAKTSIQKNQKHWTTMEFDDEGYWNNKGDTANKTTDTGSFLLAKLSPEDRFILTSHIVEGLKFEELSEITGESSIALRTKVSRIKEIIVPQL
jgi:RNA polymerase sigma-70 factor (ECF subfamily)